MALNPTYQKQLEDYKKSEEERERIEREAIQKLINEKLTTATSDINKQIAAVPGQYIDQERAVEARRIANERNLMEQMARAGAYGSGFSDTMQASINIAAGNQQSALERQKQAAIDRLNQALLELQSALRQEETSKLADLSSRTSANIANKQSELFALQKQEEAARLEQQIKQQQLQYEQQQKLLQQQRDLILSLAANKITPEQYNAVAPLYGLQPIPATTTLTTTVNGQIGAFLPNSSGAPSTTVQMSDGSLYSGYTSDAIRTGQSVANALKSGKMTKDEALDSIIMAYEGYSNADAMIELAAKTAGLSDLLKTREKQTLKK